MNDPHGPRPRGPSFLPWVGAGVALSGLGAALAASASWLVGAWYQVLKGHENLAHGASVWLAFTLAAVALIRAAYLFAVKGFAVEGSRRTSAARGSRSATQARRLGIGALLGVVLTLASVRVGAPYLAEAALDDALGHLPDHWGAVDDVDLEVLRGRYAVEGIRLLQRNEVEGDAPLLRVGRIDVGVSWKELLRGRLLADVLIDRPRVVVEVVPGADPSGDKEVRGGREGDVRESLSELLPLRIGRLVVRTGRVRYVDRTVEPDVDVDVRGISVEARDLATRPQPGVLPSKVEARGSVLGRAPVRLDLGLALLEETPRFELELEMEALPLEALNPITQAYANLDFEGGTISFYSEMAAAEGRVRGYAKPLLRNAQILDTSKNDANDPLPKVAWNALAGGVKELLTHQGEDQVATRIPIEGRLDDPDTSVATAVATLLGNAFLSALTGGTEGSISIGDVLSGG